MNKLIKKGKIALVVSLTISTVVWSIGLAAFTPTVFAASAGDLIKQEGSASVYYLGTDSKRYVFPNQSTFQAWYGSSAAVTTVSSETLLGYELGGNALARAGRLVQVVTNDTPWMVADAKVYALSNDGAIHHIDSATTAVSLFGSNWETKIIPVPEQLFSNYTVGAQLTSSSVLPDGFVVTDGTDTYLIDGGAKRAISAEGFTANKYKESDKITMTDLTAYDDGSAVSGAESGLFNVAGGATTTTVSGGLTVGLAANTPAAANIPLTAPRVDFLKLTLTASSDADVTVNTLVLNKTGLGAAATITDVYLYEGDSRLTTAKSVNSTTKDVTFNNLGLVIPAGTTKTIDVKAKMITTAASIHGFSIVSAGSITTSGATVSGSFPIAGNQMSSVSVTDLGAVTIAKAGSNSYTRKIGEKAVEIGKFTLAVTNENATFKGITIYNEDNDIFDNMTLYRGSTLLGTATESGKYFVFNFATPDSILKGETISYTLKTDIASDNTNNVATIYQKYDTDINIVGASYGYNLAVTRTYAASATGTTNDGNQNDTTIQAGAVTFAFNGPATSNISVNTDDITLLNFSIYAQSATRVEKDTFAITLTNADGDTVVTLANTIENLELVCDGAVIADYTVVAAPSNTDQWEIGAGKTMNCILRADTMSTADSGDTIVAAITTPGTSSAWTLVDIGTDANVSSVVPATTITGNTLALISAGLTVTAASTPTNRTWVKGATAEAVGFNFAASDSNAITVTSIVVGAGLDDSVVTPNVTDIVATHLSNVEDVIDSVSLWDGDTQLGETEGLTVGSSTITATFDNLSWIVPAGTTKKLTLKAKVSTNAPYGGTSDYVAFSIAIGGVSAEYGTGTSLTNVPSSAVNAGATPTYYQIVSSAGTLAIDIPTNTPSSTIAVAGSLNVPFSKIKFTATNEDFIIAKLALKNASSAYDDDISAVKVTYPTNGAQTTTETKTCTLASGVATCTGMNFFIPNPNITGNKNYATLDVTVDMQSIIGGADAADAPAFTLSLAGDLEALGKDSNTVLTESTLSVTDLTSNKNNAVETEALIAAAVANTTGTTLTIDNGSGTAITAGEIVAGDVLCITADDASDCATDGDELVYVTAATTTSLTVVRGYAGSTAANIVDNEYIYLVFTGSDRAATSPVQISTAGTVMDINGAISGTTTTSVTVAGASALTTLAVGDVVCVTPNTGTACVAGDEHLYISAVSSATGITVIRGWDDTTVAAIADDEEVFLIRKSNEVLDTKSMSVQGTKLTVAAASATTTGAQSGTEEVMKFTATSAAQGDAKIRQGMTKTTGAEGTDTGDNVTVTIDYATYDLDGSSTGITWTAAGDQTDSTVTFTATAGTLDDYARVSFWVYWNDATDTEALALTDLTAFTSTGATVALGQGTALTGTCADGAWCHIDIAVPSGTDASDVTFGIQYDEASMSAGNPTASSDILAIDDVKFYNEKIQVDMTLNENVTIPAAGNTSYLLQNGTIVATGTAGWNTTGSDNETGSIVFVPTGTYADIEISGTDTFIIQTASNIFTEAGTSTEILTLTIDLGNSGTAGDIYWYDDEGSDNVSYAGVNATDKITDSKRY